MKTPEEITRWCNMMLKHHPNIEDTNYFNSIKDYMKEQRPQAGKDFDNLDKIIELYKSKVAFYGSQNTRGEYAVTVRELKYVVETLEALRSERPQDEWIPVEGIMDLDAVIEELKTKAEYNKQLLQWLEELKAYREKDCRDCSTCARYSEFQKEIPEECKGCKHNYFSNYVEIK